MQETQARAVELTNMAEGKHHIGDFLPPDELARFMEKVSYFGGYIRTLNLYNRDMESHHTKVCSMV